LIVALKDSQFGKEGFVSMDEQMRKAFLDANMSNIGDIKNPHKMSFYERQAYFVLKKAEDLQKIEQEMTPVYHPAISRKSRVMVENRFPDSFIERNQEFLQQKELNLKILMQEKNESLYSEHTPEITPLAQMAPSKDLNQLCYGDMKKKRQVVEKLRRDNEKEFVQKHTFRPQLETNNEMAQSKLGLHLSPPAYARQIMIGNLERESRKVLAEQNREFQELSVCTFHPETTKLPAYIKRINECASSRSRGFDKENSVAN